MTSTASSTEMVNAMYQNFGLIVESLIPFLYLFFGVFMFVLGATVLQKALKGGIIKAGK